MREKKTERKEKKKFVRKGREKQASINEEETDTVRPESV